MLRCRQVERQRVLVPPFVGSNPTSAVREQMPIFAAYRCQAKLAWHRYSVQSNQLQVMLLTKGRLKVGVTIAFGYTMCFDSSRSKKSALCVFFLPKTDGTFRTTSKTCFAHKKQL